MMVRCKTASKWCFDGFTQISTMAPMVPTVEGGWLEEETENAIVYSGTIGRIVNDTRGKISVKWNSVKHMFHVHGSEWNHTCDANISHLEILTPPIHTELFKD